MIRKLKRKVAKKNKKHESKSRNETRAHSLKRVDFRSENVKIWQNAVKKLQLQQQQQKMSATVLTNVTWSIPGVKEL